MEEGREMSLFLNLFIFKIFIYLAALGLSCGMGNLLP